MNKTTENWLAGSKYDFKTAESLLKTKRYVYVIFMCHLSLEKILKAIYTEQTNKIPPRTHSLDRLLDLCDIVLCTKYDRFFREISEQSVPTRYPEDLAVLGLKLNYKMVKNILSQTKELLQWLKQNSILKK